MQLLWLPLGFVSFFPRSTWLLRANCFATAWPLDFWSVVLCAFVFARPPRSSCFASLLFLLLSKTVCGSGFFAKVALQGWIFAFSCYACWCVASPDCWVLFLMLMLMFSRVRNELSWSEYICMAVLAHFIVWMTANCVLFCDCFPTLGINSFFWKFSHCNLHFWIHILLFLIISAERIKFRSELSFKNSSRLWLFKATVDQPRIMAYGFLW